MTRILHIVVFLVGLAVAGWIGAGYIGSNPLALGVTVLIGVFYLVGARELQRYDQATSTLTRAIAGLSDVPASLAGWLDQLHPTLRNPVRLRVEGERAPLPGPTLTPYLVGLLVLLGMLGTFLGMVATLRGTGIALESATDLHAIRASLAAPVKGLGFAFGTSVAGVATSAMLGLLSALCRRERIQAARQLDVQIGSSLRGYSRSHQRDEAFKLLQKQAEVMPALVDRLQVMMSAMEQRNQALNEQMASGMSAMERQHQALNERMAAGHESLSARLLAGQDSLGEQLRTGQASLGERLLSGQDSLSRRFMASQEALDRRLASSHEALSQRLAADQEALSQRLVAGQQALGDRLVDGQEAFHDKAEAAYVRLASSVDASLKESVAESARAAGAAFQPVVQATMASLARETAVWQDTVTQAVRQQHEAITQAVQQQHESVTSAVQQQHEAVTTAVQRQLDGLSNRFESTSISVAEIWNTALAGHQRASDALAQDLRASLDRYAETVEQRSAGLLDAMSSRLNSAADRMSQAWTDALSLHEQTSGKLAEDNRLALAAATGTFAQHSSSLLTKLEDHSSSLLQRVEQHSSSTLQSVELHSASLSENLERHSSSHAQNLEQHSTSLLQKLEEHSSSLLQAMNRSQADQQAALVERDQQRLDAWTEALGTMAADLRKQWQETGEHTASRQQEICETLAQTARDITSQTQAHASMTIAEIERLVQAASEAPKAAADVVAELRQKLSDSMVRDNAMLEERARLLDTLGTLLDAVNRASTEQREAVDALVSTSADLLDRVGNQFTGKLESETGKLSEAAGQVTGSVVEVASLGEVFGAAVHSFGESNDKLMAQLERIEAALEKSIARSDEQLAYYVAQAREVVDLSVMSQKQVLEDLQQLAAQQASVGTEAE